MRLIFWRKPEAAMIEGALAGNGSYYSTWSINARKRSAWDYIFEVNFAKRSRLLQSVTVCVETYYVATPLSFDL